MVLLCLFRALAVSLCKAGMSVFMLGGYTCREAGARELPVSPGPYTLFSESPAVYPPPPPTFSASFLDPGPLGLIPSPWSPHPHPPTHTFQIVPAPVSWSPYYICGPHLAHFLVLLTNQILNHTKRTNDHLKIMPISCLPYQPNQKAGLMTVWSWPRRPWGRWISGRRKTSPTGPRWSPTCTVPWVTPTWNWVTTARRSITTPSTRRSPLSSESLRNNPAACQVPIFSYFSASFLFIPVFASKFLFFPLFVQ